MGDLAPSSMRKLRRGPHQRSGRGDWRWPLMYLNGRVFQMLVLFVNNRYRDVGLDWYTKTETGFYSTVPPNDNPDIDGYRFSTCRVRPDGTFSGSAWGFLRTRPSDSQWGRFGMSGTYSPTYSITTDGSFRHIDFNRRQEASINASPPIFTSDTHNGATMTDNVLTINGVSRGINLEGKTREFFFYDDNENIIYISTSDDFLMVYELDHRIFYGEKRFSQIYIGNKKIKSVYEGTKKVY